MGGTSLQHAESGRVGVVTRGGGTWELAAQLWEPRLVLLSRRPNSTHQTLREHLSVPRTFSPCTAPGLTLSHSSPCSNIVFMRGRLSISDRDAHHTPPAPHPLCSGFFTLSSLPTQVFRLLSVSSLEGAPGAHCLHSRAPAHIVGTYYISICGGNGYVNDFQPEVFGCFGPSGSGSSTCTYVLSRTVLPSAEMGEYFSLMCEIRKSQLFTWTPPHPL